MRTTLELLELLRDKGRETGQEKLCYQMGKMCLNDIINDDEFDLFLDYTKSNFPKDVLAYGFPSDTERYARLDQQIERLKQEEK